MKRVLSKWLLAFSLIMLMGHANAQQRYYCEVKGIEKSFTSGLKIIFDFGTEASYNMWGDLSSKLKFVDEKGKEIDFNSMWKIQCKLPPKTKRFCPLVLK